MSALDRTRSPLVICLGYIRDYFAERPDPDQLEEQVNREMLAWEEKEKERKAKLEQQVDQADEDGFVTVVNPRRNVAFEVDEGEDEDEEQGGKKKKEAEVKVYSDFYRFQVKRVKNSGKPNQFLIYLSRGG